MRLFALIMALVVLIACTPTSIQATTPDSPTITAPSESPAPTPAPPRMGRLGLGFAAGETSSMGIYPAPMYGAYVFYGVSPAVTIGLHAGFISGSSSGDEKDFDNVTTFNLAPYAQFFFASRKDFSPYIKVAFSYLSYSITTTDSYDKEKTSDKSASSIWAAIGLRYNASESVGISGGMRFLDIGISGDNKISAFGLATPSVSVDFTF